MQKRDDLQEFFSSEQIDDMINQNEKNKKRLKFLNSAKYILLGLLLIKGGAAIGKEIAIHNQEKNQSIEKTFDTGEQYVYQLQVYGKDKTKYDEVDGYKLLGFTNEDVVYTNTEPVKCVGHTNEDGYVVYSFGEPIEKNKTLELTPTTEEE